MMSVVSPLNEAGVLSQMRSNCTGLMHKRETHSISSFAENEVLQRIYYISSWK